MKFGRITIGILTAILLGLMLLAGSLENVDETVAVKLSCIVQSNQRNERIQCWMTEEEELYFFLPAYAEMEHVLLQSEGTQVVIDGVTLTDTMTCERFHLNEPYPLEYTLDEREWVTTLTFVHSDMLPTMYIDVHSQTMEYIHLNKTHEEGGSLRLYNSEGSLLHGEDISSMKGRGNTSWTAEKKPYNLTLVREVDLLGMGAAQNWILLSEGFNAANMRNKIVYDFADQAKLAFSPESTWVDLYLNGEYAGLYLLTERTEVHPERVNLSERDSFLISLENQMNMDNQKIPYVTVGSAQVLRIRELSMTEQALETIWSSLKNALLAEDGCDSVTGKHWKDLIDLDSWVRKYLIEEIFANPDGGAVSQYFYMDGADPEKKIYAGPVWDYDYSLGGEDFWMKDYDSFLIMAREYTDDGMYLPWFYELYQKEEFHQRLRELYEVEFLPLLEQLIQTYIDRYIPVISAALKMDGIRWQRSEKEIQADIELIGLFLTKRITFLSDLWINETPYHVVQVNPGRYTSGYFAVKDGDTLPELPDEEFVGRLGWYDLETGEIVDIRQPINRDMKIGLQKEEVPLPAIHYVPVVAVALILLVLAELDSYRRKKKGRMGNDLAKVT